MLLEEPFPMVLATGVLKFWLLRVTVLPPKPGAPRLRSPPVAFKTAARFRLLRKRLVLAPYKLRPPMLVRPEASSTVNWLPEAVPIPAAAPTVIAPPPKFQALLVKYTILPDDEMPTLRPTLETIALT